MAESKIVKHPIIKKTLTEVTESDTSQHYKYISNPLPNCYPSTFYVERCCAKTNADSILNPCYIQAYDLSSDSVIVRYKVPTTSFTYDLVVTWIYN